MSVAAPRTRTLFEKAELFFVFSAVVGTVAVLAKAGWEVFRPYQMDYGEGHILALALRAARGSSMYPAATEPPYVMNPYGPVPIYLLGACVKLLGVSFTLPRILVVAAGVGCAVLIGLLVRRWGGASQVALAFGLLFLTRPLLQDWLPRLKVDLIGMGFALTGFYVFAKSRRWYLSPLFFVAAVFSRSTLVAAPLACLLYAALRKEGAKAFRLAASCAVLGALAFLYAQWRTHGWFAFNTLWLSIAQPFSWTTAWWFLRAEMREDRFLIPLALALVYFARSRPALWFPLIYLALSLLTSLTVGKLGGNFNYFFEWQAALCLCVGLTYQLLRERLGLLSPQPSGVGPSPPNGHQGVRPSPKGRSHLLALLPVGLAVLLLAGVYKKLKPSPNFSGCRQVYDIVRDSPRGRVLSENLGAGILAGKTPVVFEPFLWTHEVLDAGWSDAEVVNLIRSRQIGLIVLSSDVASLKKDTKLRRWPGPVLDAIQENYRPAGQFNCLDARAIYEPKPWH